MRYRHVLLAIVAFLFSTECLAVYKCRDAEGNVSFSQSPCAANETATEVKVQGSGPKLDARTCELAGMFAEDAAKRMRGGSNFSREMDRYGGTYGAKPAIMGVVNYVYSFQLNETAPSRIGSLSRSKCENGGLGQVAFDDLPVAEYYVYDDVRHVWVKKTEMSGGFGQQQAPAQPAMPGAKPEQVSIPQGMPGSQGTMQPDCAALRQSLRELDDKMRAGYSNEQSNELREERRNLRSQLAQCP